MKAMRIIVYNLTTFDMLDITAISVAINPNTGLITVTNTTGVTSTYSNADYGVFIASTTVTATA